MHDLTALHHDILYVITKRGDPHGLAIRDELEKHYETEINRGRLYPNLDMLVEKGQQDRRTNYYALTRRGRRELEARREWENQYIDM